MTGKFQIFRYDIRKCRREMYFTRPPILTTATLLFLVSHTNHSINCSWFRIQLPEWSQIQPPFITSLLSYNNSTGSRSNSAFNSKSFSLYSRLFMTSPLHTCLTSSMFRHPTMASDPLHLFTLSFPPLTRRVSGWRLCSSSLELFSSGHSQHRLSVCF